MSAPAPRDSAARQRLTANAVRLLERVGREGEGFLIEVLSFALRVQEQRRHGRWLAHAQHERHLAKVLTSHQRVIRAAQLQARRRDRRARRRAFETTIQQRSAKASTVVQP